MRPGMAPEAHRCVFATYQLHGKQASWVLYTGTEKIAEVKETAGLVPNLEQLDELVAYSLDRSIRPKPAEEELLDLNGDGRSLDAADLTVAAQRLMGAASASANSTTVWQYYHTDHLGAPTQSTDAAGDWVSATRFHAYGRAYERRGARLEHGFAGSQREVMDELGLVRMGARWYAPDLGRWVSADRAMGIDPKGLVARPLEANLFSYAANSPTRLVDTTGAAGDDPPGGAKEGKAMQFGKGVASGFMNAAPNHPARSMLSRSRLLWAVR